MGVPRKDMEGSHMAKSTNGWPQAGAADAPAADPVDGYLRQLTRTLDALAREEIWAAVDLILATGQAQRRIYLVGNGGSAATASHMANDLNKQATVPGSPRFRAIALTDNVPLITAWSNDAHYADCFAEQLANHLEPDDLVIAISTSGNSENVLRALELARQEGARSIGFTGCDGGQLRALVDCCIFVPCDDIGQQEDIHLVLNHVITTALRARLTA
jgi:D-sedoheptulose 7-phosphate isomerase